MKLNYKGIIRFIILFLINMVVWDFFRSYINFIIGALMVVSAGISVAMTCIFAKRLKVKLLFPSGFVAPDTEFEFGVQVTNPVYFWMFFAKIVYHLGNVFVEEPREQKLNMPVYAGGKTCERNNITSNYCGIIEGKIDEFCVGDLLNLIWLPMDCREMGHVVIYPRNSIEEEEAITDVVSGFLLEEESDRKGMDYNPDYEIREYIPGDDLKAIHWKLTAKQEKLMVRERLAAGHNKVNVLLQLTKDSDLNDKLMCSLNSVCRHFLLSDFPVELCWWSYAEKQLKCRLLLEEGELQGVICEILGMNPRREDVDAGQHFQMLKGNESYVMITAGVSKGEYIRKVS